MPHPVSPAVTHQISHLTHLFTEQFGRAPRFMAMAPGRVNLIGEHTDYNGGFVLPMAIERQVVMVADTVPGKTVTLASTGINGLATFELSPELLPGQPSWSNYIRGVLVGCLQRGLNPGGFDAMIDSTVPAGGGLSSSAALEVGAATLVEAITGQTLDPIDKAMLAQKCEHEFAGMPCGIMDQFISSTGQRDHALLLDCRSHETRHIPMRDPEVSVLIIDSKVKHELTGGEYAQRREQCELAAKKLGVALLRDATMAQLDELSAQDLDDLSRRRARHVISEIERTTRAADALANNDMPAFGRLMLASHVSLRDDFEVSTPELDLLVELAMQHDDSVFGARMTGGGFGGCTVSLIRSDAVDSVSQSIAANYHQRVGVVPDCFATRPADGAHVISV